MVLDKPLTHNKYPTNISHHMLMAVIVAIIAFDSHVVTAVIVVVIISMI